MSSKEKALAGIAAPLRPQSIAVGVSRCMTKAPQQLCGRKRPRLPGRRAPRRCKSYEGIAEAERRIDRLMVIRRRQLAGLSVDRQLADLLSCSVRRPGTRRASSGRSRFFFRSSSWTPASDRRPRRHLRPPGSPPDPGGRIRCSLWNDPWNVRLSNPSSPGASTAIICAICAASARDVPGRTSCNPLVCLAWRHCCALPDLEVRWPS